MTEVDDNITASAKYDDSGFAPMTLTEEGAENLLKLWPVPDEVWCKPGQADSEEDRTLAEYAEVITRAIAILLVIACGVIVGLGLIW